MIGKRLRLARAAAGVSLRDLAVRIDNRVTAQAIGKYERDESMPGSGVLIALAKALGVSVDYLLGDERLVVEGVEFRKKASTSRREEAQVEAKLLHYLERYLKLEDLLGLASVEWDKPREAPYPARSLEDAEQAAVSLRAAWGLGLDPIPNLAELLEERAHLQLTAKTVRVGVVERTDTRASLPPSATTRPSRRPARNSTCWPSSA